MKRIGQWCSAVMSDVPKKIVAPLLIVGFIREINSVNRVCGKAFLIIRSSYPFLPKHDCKYDSELESKLHFEISRSGDSLIARVGDSRLKLSLNRDEGIFEFDGLYSEDEKKHLERLTSDLSSPERYLFANNWGVVEVSLEKHRSPKVRISRCLGA